MWRTVFVFSLALFALYGMTVFRPPLEVFIPYVEKICCNESCIFEGDCLSHLQYIGRRCGTKLSNLTDMVSNCFQYYEYF